jgi:hypothetical protein
VLDALHGPKRILGIELHPIGECSAHEDITLHVVNLALRLIAVLVLLRARREFGTLAQETKKPRPWDVQPFPHASTSVPPAEFIVPGIVAEFESVRSTQ